MPTVRSNRGSGGENKRVFKKVMFFHPVHSHCCGSVMGLPGGIADRQRHSRSPYPPVR